MTSLRQALALPACPRRPTAEEMLPAAGTTGGIEHDGTGQAGPRGHGGGHGPEAAGVGAILTTPLGSYQDAIRTLNTLQTNASYLEQVKRERGDPQAQLEAMRGFLERSGLKVRGESLSLSPHPDSGATMLGVCCCEGFTGWLTSGRSRTWID